MITQLTPDKNDDPEFICIVNRIISDVLVQNRPKEIYIIHIARWFDHKWLEFSGRGVVDFPYGYPWFETALDEFSQDKTTFPPFTPKRVIKQQYFSQNANGDYIESQPPELPHKRKHQSSNKNLQRRVQTLSDSAVFVWYSSDTVKNLRGSLMVYIALGDQMKTWFASFRKDKEWKLSLAKQIDRAEILKSMGS
jgi:hypothetical protein